jgi:hypothetical protein
VGSVLSKITEMRRGVPVDREPSKPRIALASSGSAARACTFLIDYSAPDWTRNSGAAISDGI